MSLKELLPAAEQGPAPSVSTALKTRRRPGRRDQVSPDLVPLLRSPTTADICEPSLGEADAQFIEDNLASVKGIMFALVLSVPLWAGIVFAVWSVIR